MPDEITYLEIERKNGFEIEKLVILVGLKSEDLPAVEVVETPVRESAATGNTPRETREEPTF